jgi:hypothetical protein
MSNTKYHGAISQQAASQLQRDIDALPEEAQNLLVDFVELLKKQYSQAGSEAQAAEKSNFEKFEEIGFIGCCDVEVG